MKKVFPSLQKKPKLYQTELPTEICESLRVSSETPHRFEDLIEKELSRLESELDSYEISSMNSVQKDFLPYKSYLQGLALVLRKTKPVLSSKLLRGISGWDKATTLPKSIQKAEKTLKILEKSSKNVETQTEVKEEVKESKHHEEILKFLSLSKSIKKVKLSRLTSKLNDIYEKLRVIDVDVPDGSATPELPEYDLEDLKQFSPRVFFQEKKLQSSKDKQKVIKGKLMIDKEVQVAFQFKSNSFGEGSVEREIELVRKKRELEVALKENKVLIERIKILSQKNEMKGKVEVFDEEMENIIKGEKFDKKSLDILTHKLEVIGAKTIKQQKKIMSLESMLFNAKVLWKTAEEKLKQISQAWDKQIGTSFKFKDVDLAKIIQEIKDSEETDKIIIKNLKFEITSQVDQNENNLKPSDIQERDQLENSSKRISRSNSPKKPKKSETEKKDKKSKKKEKNLENPEKRPKNPEKPKNAEKSKNPEKMLKSSSSSSSSSSLKPQLINRVSNNQDLFEDPKTTSNAKPSKHQLSDINSPRPPDIPSHKKNKTVRLDMKVSSLDSSQVEIPVASISRTQKLKQRIILPLSQSPLESSWPEQSDYNVNLKPRYLKPSGLTPAELTPDNYEEFLMNAFDLDKAFILKNFIEKLLLKSLPKTRYSKDLEKIFKKNEIHPKFENFREKREEPKIDESYFDFLEMEEKEKPKEVLKKVFNNEELRLLPQVAKKKIKELLVSHDLNCDDICEHLKRVLALKHKIFGIRYPLKTQYLKFKSLM